MKKVLFSLLAVAALAACTKTEPVYTDGDSEIKISPVTSLSTKAKVNQAIDGTAYPADEHFTVIGYWNEAGAGSTFEDGTIYLDNVNFAKNGNFWAGADKDGKHTPLYWPKNGSLRFAAYSPTALDGGTLTHTLATDTWVVNNYVQNADTKKTIDFMIAQTPPSYTAQTATERVSVVFEHALSWLSFNIKAKDETAAAAFDVKKIVVNDVFTQGNLNAKYPAKDWTVIAGSACDYNVIDDAPGLAVAPVAIENNGVVVIPQATTTVTVTFVQNTLPGVEQSITVPLILDVENTPWEAGKHYIYTIIFSVDEILINPSVKDWEDVVVEELVYDDITVEAGETVNVPTDAVIKSSIVVKGTLDGQGHTLASAEVPTDNGMIRPEGEANVKNMTIDGNDRSWDDNGTSRGLRAIYLTKAGTYNVDNVNIINTAYAINVNTTEAVTLNVSNSTLQGWTSYGGSTTANFKNVVFSIGDFYSTSSYSANDNGLFRPYGNTVCENCSFPKDFVIDLGSQGAGKSITFKNCTYDGAALTAENLTGATGKNVTIE